MVMARCISFDSYIKPQPIHCHFSQNWVVYLLTPTSNHNYILPLLIKDVLYIF